MNVIVDTNIVFSALLNSNSKIAELLFYSGDTFRFYSCNYMRFEIRKHWDKLKSISSLSDFELEQSQYRLYSRIKFIDEELIPERIWYKAENLVSDIDPGDIPFIALTQYLDALLWTGDKVLYKGLKAKKYDKVINIKDVIALL